MFQISNHQPIEEGAVVQQGLAEVFRRDFLALMPLLLQGAVFVGEHLGDLRDHLSASPSGRGRD